MATNPTKQDRTHLDVLEWGKEIARRANPLYHAATGDASVRPGRSLSAAASRKVSKGTCWHETVASRCLDSYIPTVLEMIPHAEPDRKPGLYSNSGKLRAEVRTLCQAIHNSLHEVSA